MTDRERLLEQVRAAEAMAACAWLWIRPEYYVGTPVETVADWAATHARYAAHHALTALALRYAIVVLDHYDRRGMHLYEHFLQSMGYGEYK